MAIGTNAGAWFYGTQTAVSSSQTTVADNAYQACGVDFTNTANAPFASAVMEIAFDTTAPTVGNVLLFAMLHNVQSTNDMDAVGATNQNVLCGAFPIIASKTIDTLYYTVIPHFELPAAGDGQVIRFYILNNATGQTIQTGWQLWITQKTMGPTA